LLRLGVFESECRRLQHLLTLHTCFLKDAFQHACARYDKQHVMRQVEYGDASGPADVMTLEEVQENLASNRYQLVDARSFARSPPPPSLSFALLLSCSLAFPSKLLSFVVSSIVSAHKANLSPGRDMLHKVALFLLDASKFEEIIPGHMGRLALTRPPKDSLALTDMDS